MPQYGQKGVTFKAKFVEGIEEFIVKYPELGWTSVPEALRSAWNSFAFEYERGGRLVLSPRIKKDVKK